MSKPDVLHVNSSKTGGLGAFVGWLLSVSHVIFTVHGWPFKEERPWLQTMLISFFSWLTVVFADTTIVVSDDDYRRSKWMPFVQKKIARVHNGIESGTFLSPKSAKKALLSRFQAPSYFDTKTTWIGTLSELTPNKGLTYLIQACKEFKKQYGDFICLVLGTGELEQELQKEIDSYGLGQHILLLGFIPDAASLLPAFDIVTMTSVKEGLPYMLLEAGCAGSSVVATRVGGIPEIITNGLTGILVPPHNAAEIARAFIELSKNKKKRETFGEALRQTVIEAFSLQTMLSQTFSLYEESS
jgi:glycosyltransferase involved in cell wall biosynthesis